MSKKLGWNGKGIKIRDEHSLNSESANELLQFIRDLNRESLQTKTSSEEETKQRTSLGWKDFDRYSSLKRKVSDQCVLPVMTYASETWGGTRLLDAKPIRAQRGMEGLIR
ncbi:uncharacterized protein LOC134777761 [Penaeus indicus]|uniref:uncharacterized protein LOC134777761 n=1 Tax=Penaeus indicus TaxID=29960 RepID=UPI00300D9E76